MSPAAPPLSRSTLFSRLSEACELEHGLSCSYLFTAFTLKQDLAEGGLDWRQLQLVRLWAAQIYFVASEEMLHLAQVWNLLAAMGGTPYYQRPNFPQNSKYYPLGIALKLEPFGLPALDRFIAYELPSDVPAENLTLPSLGLTAGDLRPAGRQTVGELYAEIAQAVQAWPEEALFIGDPARQTGPEEVHFPDLVKVTSRESALLAIMTITEQGEGTRADRTDCHYGAFLKVREEFLAEGARAKAAGQEFHPTRPVVTNPTPRRRPDQPAHMHLLTNSYTIRVAELFDGIYLLMLRMLQFAFSEHPQKGPLAREFAQAAILLMPTVVKPLGEALTILPADREGGPETAGPSFAMTRHVPLPVDPQTAAQVVREALAELAAEAEALAGAAQAPVPLRKAAASLRRAERAGTSGA